MLRTLNIMALLGLRALAASAQPCSPYWSAPGSPPAPYISDYNRTLVVFDDGNAPALYLTGRFGPPGSGNSLDAVWRWRGQGWEAVGPGQLVGWGVEISVLDQGGGPHLFSYGHTESPTVWWLKRWTGGPGGMWVNAPEGMLRIWTAQSPVGCQPKVFGVTQEGPGIFGWWAAQSAGLFVARWNGSGWTTMGPGFDSVPLHYLVCDSGAGPMLHVAGGFGFIGGISKPRVARWNGSTWEGLQTGPYSDLVRDLCIYDDGSGPSLYIACGGLDPLNPVFGGGIARWDGQQWSAVGGGVWAPAGSFSGVKTLATFDDGSGLALYVAGTFTHAGGFGGIPAQNIARWNGQQWSAVGPGMGSGFGGVADMEPFDDPRGPSLFMAGDFNTAGGGQSPSIAQLVGCPNCYANCDASTIPPRLNVLDFTCFLNRFARNDPYANCNGDGAINVMDFSCFLARFAAGCRKPKARAERGRADPSFSWRARVSGG
jgi:hypothetical protein